MGTQLNMLEEFYADDKRKGDILKGLQALAREVRWVYGLLYSYEGSMDMFSSAGKRANTAMDALEDVKTAIAMVVYDELSDLPQLQGQDLETTVSEFCKLELVGMPPPVPTKTSMTDSAYVLPKSLFKVSDEIESKRKEILLNTLLSFITKVEEL